jgi:TetR/AcrR family transcriptional regulator
MAMKAERKRAAILAAAEEQFARRGYDATRLDDVAETLDITGAALFYYFQDKESLYDAIMKNAFSTLTQRLSDVLTSDATIVQQIERAVEVWIDTIVERPALGRLILRHIVDNEQHPNRRIYPASDAFLRLAFALFEKGRQTGELNPIHDHPYHATSAVVGSTIFYASALAPLVPAGDFNPMSSDQIAAHKRDAIVLTRRYLGITSKPRTRETKKPTTRPRTKKHAKSPR